jgi:hypothetical protein
MLKQYCKCDRCGASIGIDANVSICLACDLEQRQEAAELEIEKREEQAREEEIYNSDEAQAYRAAAAALGRKGGEAKTEAKAKASAENGKKGGRPRKTAQD